MDTCINEKEIRDIHLAVKKLAENIVYERLYNLFEAEIRKSSGEVRFYEIMNAVKSVTERNSKFTYEDVLEIMKNALDSINEYFSKKGCVFKVEECSWFLENSCVRIIKIKE